MQADQNERVEQSDTKRRHSTQTMVTAIAVLILAGGAYLLVPGDADEAASEDVSALPEASPTSSQPPMPLPESAVLNAPDIPEVEDVAPPPAVEPEPLPALTPEEIDAQIREAVDSANLSPDEQLASAYAAPWLLDRAISAGDQVARGLVPVRALNLPRPEGAFPVQRDGQRRFVDPAGYERYDSVVEAITALPAASISSLFHRFRPQLQDAYAALGYPADSMDNTLIAALDEILAAPEESGAIELRTKGALYAYSDEELEKASDIHKQLLRSGPENTRKLKRWAQRVREALLNP